MTGVWIGVDPGDARIGLAVSDKSGVLAVPLGTVPAGSDAIAAIALEVRDTEAELVLVGLPRSLDGTEGHAAAKVRDFAAQLAAVVGIPVRLVDERLTTVSASRALHQAGRNTKQQREVIDQAAAVELLQRALEQAQRRGTEIGELVPAGTDS